MGVQLEITSVPVVKELMLKFSVITESQPAAFVKVKVGVLVEDEYVTPSIQVNGPQLCCTSVAELACNKVKFNVITESHPAADPPAMVNVAVLLLALYVLPSSQVIGVQLEMLFVALVKELMLKFSVITESQPAADPPAMVNVAVLLLAL
jgi:hypothetical protein